STGHEFSVPSRPRKADRFCERPILPLGGRVRQYELGTRQVALASRVTPFREWRARLESILSSAAAPLYITPATRHRLTASDWFRRPGRIAQPAAVPEGS